MKRQCKACGEEKEMARSGKYPDGKIKYRGVCKSCHSKRVLHDQKNLAMTKNPEKFSQCNECCHIWTLGVSHLNCPKCGTTNIERKKLYRAISVNGSVLAIGASHRELASKLGVSYTTIENRLKRNIKNYSHVWGEQYRFNVEVF